MKIILETNHIFIFRNDNHRGPDIFFTQTIQGQFNHSLVQIGPVVLEKVKM